ncbi:MAG: rRNA-processing protein sof1 [Vezdaea acicularis]|nr:MAG: rRNA-processing protein sof1 [Vezdaea acicularis]
MKIKALTRPSSSVQTPGSTVQKAPRNLDPNLHPFARAREYTRALNATKLSRVFAAPFIAQLGNGHVDGVYALATDPASLTRLASGSGDGVVKVWDLPSRREVWQVQAHGASSIVKDVCWTHDAKLLTCSADKTIKLFDPYDPASTNNNHPLTSFLGSTAFNALSHHRSDPVFAAAGSSSIFIYDLTQHSTSTALQTLRWPTTDDTIRSISFNPTETSLLASCSTDRSLILYDLRTSTPLHKSILTHPLNALSWNPMEAFNLAAASEDHNIYLFDSRNLSRALNVLRDHVHAVMDVRFSPTGEELVSASYDRSIRLWRRADGHSRDIYHTKRMQRVFRCAFSPDATYLLSGSDDGNIRLWRAQASERGGIKSARERQKREYDDVLKSRYAHLPEIRRIDRHRHLPRVVKKAAEIKREELAALKRRRENERKHSKLGKTRRRSEREKVVLAEEE